MFFVNYREFSGQSENVESIWKSLPNLIISYGCYCVFPLFVAFSVAFVTPGLFICTELKSPFLLNNRSMVSHPI